MKTITIYPPVVILDDTEFCMNRVNGVLGECKELFENDEEEWECSQFNEITEPTKDSGGAPVKCQQCKDEYQRQMIKLTNL